MEYNNHKVTYNEPTMRMMANLEKEQDETPMQAVVNLIEAIELKIDGESPVDLPMSVGMDLVEQIMEEATTPNLAQPTSSST